MKTYRYQDPGGTYDLTEADILKEYFPYWSSEMKRVGKEDLISPERCIEDYVTIHWAWEV